MKDFNKVVSIQDLQPGDLVAFKTGDYGRITIEYNLDNKPNTVDRYYTIMSAKTGRVYSLVEILAIISPEPMLITREDFPSAFYCYGLKEATYGEKAYFIDKTGSIKDIIKRMSDVREEIYNLLSQVKFLRVRYIEDINAEQLMFVKTKYFITDPEGKIDVRGAQKPLQFSLTYRDKYLQDFSISYTYCSQFTLEVKDDTLEVCLF